MKRLLKDYRKLTQEASAICEELDALYCVDEKRLEKYKRRIDAIKRKRGDCEERFWLIVKETPFRELFDVFESDLAALRAVRLASEAFESLGATV